MKTKLIAAVLLLAMQPPIFAAEIDAAIFQPGNRILFQGDSITDGARNRNNDLYNVMGNSYAQLVAAKYSAVYAERKLEFFNRGISGNKVPDLLNRWDKDALELKPTVVSILIGVNDIWHPLNANQEVSVEKFEEGYDKLLAQTVAALPNVKIILLEPFITSGRATTPKWDVWQEHLKKYQAVVAKLGTKYKAPVVKLQRVFDETSKRAPAEYWVYDGVHPTFAGNQLIADEWVRVAAAAWPAAK
jgi:lysophospholipase L1-like esterase